MPTLADAAVQLLAAGVPILFLDTCIFLDVIRAPARGLVRCIEAATDLHSLATSIPAQCNLVVGSFVPNEWADHENDVVELVDTHLDRMEQQANDFHGACIHLGIPVPFSRPGYAAVGLTSRLHDLSRQLLQASLVLDRDQIAMSRAYDRVALTKRRPCRKGGELKDCQIFEECLEVARQLQAGGFTRKMIFCTSNTEDYCSPGIIPHPDVATDCGSTGLLFTNTLPWAVNELKT